MRTDAQRAYARTYERNERVRMNRDLRAIRAARPVLAPWEIVRLGELIAATQKVIQ